MDQNIYSNPANNLGCSYRFTCGAVKCPEVAAASGKPSCHIEKFRRYQPSDETWYRKDWEDVNRITWREVFCLQESWIYVLYIIIIIVFIFMAMVLMRLLLRT